MTTVQKALPKGWKWVRLGEVCEFIYGDSLPERKRQVGNVPVFGSNGIVGAHDSPISDGETIIIGRKGSVGEINFSPNSCFPIDTTYFIDKRHTQQNIKWLYWSLKSLKLDSLSLTVGVPGLNRKDAYKVKFPLPPLPAQHKIVEILEKADNLRKLRQQADEKMKDLIPSLFVQMFGDPATNPKGWKVIELRKTSTFKRGPFGGSLKKEIFVKNGYKVYEQKNAIYNDFEIGNYFVDEDKYHEMIAFAIQPDDLIISCSGTMGKVAIVPRSAKQGIINQALLKITPLKNMAIPLYLKFLFESRSLQNKYFSNAAGSAIQNVTSVDSLKRIKVPLPPLPLQQEFAKLVEEVESEKARQTESRKKLDELFNSLMQRAFTGELVA